MDNLMRAGNRVSVSIMAAESKIDRLQAQEERNLYRALADAWAAKDWARYDRLMAQRRGSGGFGLSFGFGRLTGMSRPMC